MPKDIQALIENTNRSLYSAQIGSKNQQTIKLSLEDNKSQNEPIKGVPMPKEIKERIEQMKSLRRRVSLLKSTCLVSKKLKESKLVPLAYKMNGKLEISELLNVSPEFL